MEKIVVGVDGSEESKDALRFAVEEGGLRGAAVVAVHAWTVPLPPSADPLVPASIDYPGLVAVAQEGAERFLQATIEEVVGEQPSVQVEPLAIEGSAAAVLLDAAAEAFMLVVGSRGRGGFERLVLGSVSEQVARHAPCPVLIHRTGQPREA
jgi:nucleotide-binding universal stress UspA family protein